MIKPITLNGEQYNRVKHIAALTNRTTQTIYNLIRYGNSVRELKSVHIAENVYIPVSELTEFPFTSPGPHSDRRIYHFNEKGEVV